MRVRLGNFVRRAGQVALLFADEGPVKPAPWAPLLAVRSHRLSQKEDLAVPARKVNLLRVFNDCPERLTPDDASPKRVLLIVGLRG